MSTYEEHAEALTGQLTNGHYAEEAAVLAQAWEALRCKLQEQTQRKDPGFEYVEWEDGPEELAMKRYLFWWTWGN